MVKLLRTELFKVMYNSLFLYALALLLCANAFLVWREIRDDGDAHAEKQLTSELTGLSMEEKQKHLAAEYARIEALYKIEGLYQVEAYGVTDYSMYVRERYESILNAYGELYHSGNYLRYAQSLNAEYEYLRYIYSGFSDVYNFEGFLDDIENKTAVYSGISIFQSEASGQYDQASFAKTAAVYDSLRGSEINYYPEKGLTGAISNRYTDILAILSMFPLAMAIVTYEKESGLLTMVRSTRRGRVATSLAKLACLLSVLAAITLLFYGSNLLIYGNAYGLGSLSRSIQSVPSLMRSPHAITVAQYLIAFILVKWAALAIVSAIILVAALLFSQVYLQFIAAVLALGLGLLCRAIFSPVGHFAMLKYGNVISYLKTNEILGDYLNIYFVGVPISRTVFEMASAFLTGLIVTIAFVYLFSKRFLLEFRFRCSQKKQLPFLLGRQNQNKKGKTLYHQELYKLFTANGLTLLLLFFVVLQVYQTITVDAYIDPSEMYYRKYMTQLQGDYDLAAREYMLMEKAGFEPVFAIQNAYQGKEIDQQAYEELLGQHRYLTANLSVFTRIAETKIPYVIKNPGAKLVYDTGYIKLFGLDEHPSERMMHLQLTCIVCIAALSAYFGIEKSSKAIRLIRVSLYGRLYLARVKFKVSKAVAVVVSILVPAPYYWGVVKHYGLPGILFPLRSLMPYSAYPVYIPILFAILVDIAGRFVGTYALVSVVNAISFKTGNVVTTISASLLLFALLPVFYLAGITVAQWGSLYPLFNAPVLLSTTGGLLLLACYFAMGVAISLYSQIYLLKKFGEADD